VMGFFDGYPYNLNNYRVYHDPSEDRWTLLPTGLDQLFEREVNPFDPAGMLSVRCLAEADCEAAFRTRLTQVVDLFEASDYPAMARAIAQQIEAEVAADPRKEISMDEWRAAVERTVRYMQQRPAQLRDQLARTRPREQARPEEYFSMQALTDPQGKRFVAIRWFLPEGGVAKEQQWLVAQGYFEQLEATMDALSLPGASAEGVKTGTISVGYQDCQTARVIYQPSDTSLARRSRSAAIDPKIWKYCSSGS